MPIRPPALLSRSALALLALVLAALALTATSARAGGDSEQRLVVRGEATAVDGPCDQNVCPLELREGSFRGTPVGSGAYSGSIRIRVAATFPNGEDGFCAPFRGRVVLGEGTPDRLILAVLGDSCQDGAAPLPESSFTGLAQFTVRRGTGKYAGAEGSGLASLTEDAANRHRITLIGRIYG